MVEPTEQPLDPDAARFVSRLRWLMAVSGLTTLVAIAAVLGVIGYRVFKAEGSAGPVEATALLPRGARVISAVPAEGRLVVTVEVAGSVEIHTFDLGTLRRIGRLRFATEP